MAKSLPRASAALVSRFRKTLRGGTRSGLWLRIPLPCSSARNIERTHRRGREDHDEEEDAEAGQAGSHPQEREAARRDSQEPGRKKTAGVKQRTAARKPAAANTAGSGLVYTDLLREALAARTR